jgi:hypothetical protein
VDGFAVNGFLTGTAAAGADTVVPFGVFVANRHTATTMTPTPRTGTAAAAVAHTLDTTPAIPVTTDDAPITMVVMIPRTNAAWTVRNPTYR